ncbi:MAG: haloacid dehalogenase-like hydrolase [Thermomicrobiales bacterium]|nr:haloacid dehalogenase-like hydrolase [Thermomicrobiales bacterium]
MSAVLTSWNDTPAKAAIVDFVERTTTPGSPDFVDPVDRLAVFDNDGTLWTEQPMYNQGFFAFDRVRELAPDHPEWAETQPFKAVLENDMQTLAASGMQGLAQIVMSTHAGMSAEQFVEIVRDWIAQAKHPVRKRSYPATAYAPMLELIAYLQANGYRTYIVSGGGVEFMRAFVPDAYGIPVDQIIGSTIKTKFEEVDGEPQLVRLPELDFFDDGDGKPVAIGKFIGQRPVICVGNSDGDLPMLQYTAAGDGPRLMLLLHHDDAAREAAYDRAASIGTLDKALDEARERDWIVISMKRDFGAVFVD